MYKEHYITRKYWSVSQLANLLGVYPSKIHFWIKSVPSLEPKHRLRRGKQKVRRFTKEDVERFKEVQRLVEVELYTIKGAEKQLLKNERTI